MRVTWLVALLAVGCGGGNKGKSLTVSVTSACDTIARVELNVAVTPQARALQPTQLAGPGPHRVLLLLPESTTAVTVDAVGIDGAGGAVAISPSKQVAFTGPAALTEALVIGEGCADLGVEPDLAEPDLAPQPDLELPIDLGSTDLSTLIEAQGEKGLPFEAEGAELPAAGGVAVLITGTGFTAGSTVTSGYAGVNAIGPIFVSTDGKYIATSFKLVPDTLLNAGSFGLVSVTVDGTKTVSFPLKGLNELDITGTNMMTVSADTSYSRVTMAAGATLRTSGSAPIQLWVPGLFTAGIIDAVAGGFQGCTGTACAGGPNGPGFGPGGMTGPASGGGAGHAMMGSGGNLTVGGDAYGDPSLNNFRGGSGGGSGNAGTVAGGSGGGALRIRAGRINLLGALSADGVAGSSTLVAGGSGAGGSGGSVLLQGMAGVNGGAVSARPGAPGSAVALGAAGGASSAGRIRVDTGVTTAITTTFNPAVPYYGAMIASDWPSAFRSAPVTIDVICAQSSFVVEIDGVAASAVKGCAASLPARVTVILSQEPPVRKISRICVRSLPVDATKLPRGDEDLSCRAIAVSGS